MTSAAALRRGWCPGAHTPMETGDGWLVRVRPRAGAYTLDQLCAIGEAAAACGNGAIDLTNRANLQIRGLTPETMAKAQNILFEAGLIDHDPAIEAIRNILVSPFGGLDPAAFDMGPLALSLEAALCSTVRLRALDGKFGFALDGGGRFPLSVNSADIVLQVSTEAFYLRLSGDPGICAAVDDKIAVETMIRLAAVFLDHSGIYPSVRRMRDLVDVLGAEAIYKLAGLDPVTRPHPVRTESMAPIGYLGAPGELWGLAIGLPYGRITAEALFDLVGAARTAGVSEFRPSPSRSLIIALKGEAVPSIVKSALKSSLITTRDEPRLIMDACPGAPACERGTTATRADADAIAAALSVFPQRSWPVHVSGCAKGCARRASAAFTFVARDGRYDLIRDGGVTGVALQTGIAGADLKEVIMSSLGGGRA